jgi:phosphatidylserine/phosphatidylglycerophosphate/cardiolipin synthase-like enzyme
MVADDRRAAIASLNLTAKCFESTCDFVLVSSDADLVRAVRRVFEADWEGVSYRTSADDGRLIVGPEHARARFASLIGQATRSIRLIDPKVSDPGMLLLLRRREVEGISVDVRGQSGLGQLAAHGKLLMIDDTTAVIGSISLSTLLEFRRELAVVIRDDDALGALNRFWQALPPSSEWSAAAAVSLEIS